VCIMKLNVSYPPTAAQKALEIDDELKLRTFYDKRMSQEVEGDALGDQFKGYVFRITGGNDKQGFPMKQGVLVNHRVRLLLSTGHSCYRPRRSGERKRKSVRGCIVGPDLSVIHLVIVKKGEEEIPGLTDKYIPRRLGPKRASKIRRLFNLTKKDDVRKYVIRRELPQKEGKEGKKKVTKAPRIQRLVTPLSLQRKRHRLALKKQRSEKNRTEAAEYAKIVAQRNKEQRDRRQQSISKKRSQKGSTSEPKKAPAVEQPKKEQSKEQPKKEQPKKDQPKKDQPKKDQPKKEQAKKDQPKKEQPKKEQPKEQPKKDQPKKEQPKKAPKEQQKKEQKKA